MDADKFFLKSRTILAMIVVLFVQLAPELGLSFGDVDGAMITDLWDTLLSSAAAIIGVYGRFKAKSNLTLLGS